MAYKRNMGLWGIMFSAVSAMIGSGCLFSAMLLSKATGPLSILAWVIGALLIVIVAFTYAELSTMLPVTGGSARFPQLTHGTFTSLAFAWVTWINLVTAPPIEVQAILQYSSIYWPSLVDSQSHGLTHLGFLWATLLMLFLSFLNAYSIRLVNRFNTILTIWKVLIPTIVAIVLIVVAGHFSNFTNPQTGGFVPYGWHSLFVVISTGGVIFAFNGYKQVVELAGETSNPKRNILIALVGSLTIVTFIYLLLQVGFIAAVPHDALAEGGWKALAFEGDAGPIAGLLMTMGLVFFATLLYSQALVATSAAGIVYSTSAARTIYAMSANGQLPKPFSLLSPRGTPTNAVILNFVIGMLFFLPFKGWSQMIEFMSSVIALSYISGPICCFAARFQLRAVERKFRLPLAGFWCYLAFFICTCLVFWGGWHSVKILAIVLFVSLLLFLGYQAISKRARNLSWNFRESAWFWVYFIGVTAITGLGADDGLNCLPAWGDYLALALLCLVCLILAIRFRLPESRAQHVFELLLAEAKTGKPADLAH